VCGYKLKIVILWGASLAEDPTRKQSPERVPERPAPGPE